MKWNTDLVKLEDLYIEAIGVIRNTIETQDIRIGLGFLGIIQEEIEETVNNIKKEKEYE